MQGSSNIFIGAILPYYGDLKKIPHGWYLCDGQNGTPDLRGKTIIGTGVFNDNYGSINYALGNIGGERYHQLSIAEMPSHRHYGDSPFNYAGFDLSGAATSGIDKGWPIGISLGDNGPWNNYYLPFQTALTGGNQAHNIMQPYVALHYIMRVK